MLRWLLLAPPMGADGRGGGIVRWSNEFAQAMSARDDVELHVRVNEAARPFVVDELGVPARRVHTFPQTRDVVRDSLAIRAGYRVVPRGLDFDVVHGVKHLVPRRVDALRVLTVHDMVLFDRPDDFGALKRYLLRAPYRSSLSDAEALLCVSNATRARLVSHLPQVAPRASVIHPGMSSSLLAADRREIERLRGARFALVVGDASPRKNVGVVMDAWPFVRRRVPDATLVLVGPPDWSRSPADEQVAALRAEGSVVDLGTVSDGELAWAYGHASAVVFPSLLEGYGMPAMEAVAFGAPLIRSADPAAREAANGHGVEMDALDPVAWADAIVEHLERPRRAEPRLARSWTVAAEEIVHAVRARRSDPVSTT